MRHITETVKNNHKGFTLVEVSIVALIFGLIIAAFFPAYRLYLENQAQIQTSTNIDLITSEIGEFLTVQGRYPCPAPPNVDRNDPNFGRESTECFNTAALVALNSCDGNRNTPTAGICIEQSQYDTASPNDRRIVVGTIPFRQLNLDEDDIVDGYGNFYTYAVTEDMANKNNFTRYGGGIQILDVNGAPIVKDDPEGPTPENESATSHFIVISHGKNGYGAYSANGTQNPCDLINTSTLNPITSILERDNCSADSGFDGTFRLSSRSDNASNNTEYDDVSSVFLRDDVPSWSLTGGAAEHINLIEAAGNVGMLSSNPFVNNIEEELEVGGIIRTNQALNAESICDYNNVSPDCFSAEKIAADDPDMECPSGQYLVKVANAKFECQDVISVTCAPGSFAVGVDGEGNVICQSTTGCPETQVELCPVQGDPAVIIPAGNEGDITGWIQSASLAGNRKRARFLCNSGGWTISSQAGVCECVGGTVSILSAPCGGCTIGTFSKITEKICPDNIISTSTDEATACTCSASAQLGNCKSTAPFSCPTGFIHADPGNPAQYERIFECGPSGEPLGYASRTKVPGTGTPFVEPVHDDCVCNVGSNSTRLRACHHFRPGFIAKPGFSGIPQIRIFDCGRTPPGLGPWQLDLSLVPPGVTDYNTAVDAMCECNTSNPDLTYTKSCNSVFGTPSVSFLGDIPYKRVWDCGTTPPAYGPEIIDSATPYADAAAIKAAFCTELPPIQCEWSPNVSGSPPRAEFPGPNLSFSSQRSCDCAAESGDVQACHKTIGDGSTAIVYNECICQVK